MTRGRRAGLALAAVALAASAYLTVAHFTTPEVLACSESGTVNCTAVTTSRWSEIGGVPVAVLGLAWAIGMVALFLPIADGWSWAGRARRLGALGGAVAVLWLVYVEVALVRAICLWCTVVHVVALGMFAITSSGLDAPPDQPA